MPPSSTMIRAGSTQPTPVATLPQGFAALAKTPVNAKPSDGVFDAYIWFASPKSGQWADMSKKLNGLVDGDPVFVSQDHCEILRVIKYHLITADQYWARKDAKTGQPAGGVTFEEDRSKEEYIDAVILVQTSKGLLPARCRFKSGLVTAAYPAIKELQIVSDELDAWASRSEAHKLAAKLQVPAPGFRFVVEASFATRTSKGSGLPYLSGRATCRPVSIDDAKLFEGLGKPDVARLMELVAAEHAKRLDAIKKLPA